MALLLKTKWRRNTHQCDVEYITPLEKCKDNYYQLKLDSIWAQASETAPVVVPVSGLFADSSYIASIDSDEIDDNKTIAEYSNHIVDLLNGQGQGQHQRPCENFLKVLQENHLTVPQAIYNENTTDGFRDCP